MAEAAIDPRPGLPWTQRAYEALPLAPIWTGLLVAGSLSAVFVAVELAVGRFAELATLVRTDPGAYRDVRLTFVNLLLVGYLPTAYCYAGRGARRTREALAPVLAPGDDGGGRQPGAYSKNALRWAGWIGLAFALVSQFLTFGTPNPYDVTIWNPEVPWHRVTTPIIGWWGGRLVYAVLEESRTLSELATRVRPIDLFDLRPLAPFGRQGLLNALLVVGAVSILTLFLTESGYALMIALALLLIVPVAAAGLLLPVRGVRRRVLEEKQRELDWCHAALRRARAGDGAGMADLLAYRTHVEAVREWPFDPSTFARLGLYLLIPLGSWLGGALVERGIDALLE